MIKAIIWDMDGVISDTQKLHSLIESELLARYGVILSPEEITAKYAGVRTKDFFEDLLKKKGARGYNVADLMLEKLNKSTELVSEVKPIPGAIDLIKKVYAQKIPQAVASASGKKYVTAVLNQLNLINYFSAIITGDDVLQGKPDPEIFLKAANALKKDAKDCVVIEDGVSGMTGAKTAGMKCIGLVYDDKKYPVDLKINNLEKLKLDQILSL